MRQIWILGDDSRAQSRLSSAMTEAKYGVKYRVQMVSSLNDVPAEHFANAGVTFLLDAFNNSNPGFEALKRLRSKGFKGPVFLLGEPAPEDAAEPFLKESLTAFLPPVDRFDPHFAAGLIHACHHFSGDLDLKTFLDTSGKAAHEHIQSIKEFNQLVLKLMNFLSRFGVNIQKLKRSLVGLSSSHVKNTPKGPTVVTPFRLCYALDSHKLLLAVSLLAEETDIKILKEEFSQTLAQVKAQSEARTSRLDFLNVAKMTSNIVFIGGSAKLDSKAEPYLMTAISFAKSGETLAEPYFFGFVVADKTDELSESSGASLTAALPLKLHEPTIIGDTPDAFIESDSTPAVENPDSGVGREEFTIEQAKPSLPAEVDVDRIASLELEKQLAHLKSEQASLQKVAEALAADVKRLMKERREPLTDADLKESLNEANLRLKRLQEQNKKLIEQISQKDSQIELLKAQVERLKSNAA